jgi:hypothetical protein
MRVQSAFMLGHATTVQDYGVEQAREPRSAKNAAKIAEFWLLSQDLIEMKHASLSPSVRAPFPLWL